MRGFEGIGNLQRHLQGVADSQRTFERHPFDDLEHQVLRTDVEDLTDVRVVQSSNHACFLFEPGTVLSLEALDRDDAVEASISRLLHLSHTPGVEERKNLVRTESVAGAKHGELEPKPIPFLSRVAG